MNDLFAGTFFPTEATKQELIQKFWEQNTIIQGFRDYLHWNGLDTKKIEAAALEAKEHEFDESWEPEPLPLNEYTKRALDEAGNNRVRLQYLLEQHLEDALKTLQEHGYITWEEQEQLQGDTTVMVVI